MRRKKFISMLCAMVFAIVSLHSLTPHKHHCNEAQESHLHDFAHCEQLDIFVPADAEAETMPFSGITAIFPFRSAVLSVDSFPSRTLADCSDRFSAKVNPDTGGPGLRAPPAA